MVLCLGCINLHLLYLQSSDVESLNHNHRDTDKTIEYHNEDKKTLTVPSENGTSSPNPLRVILPSGLPVNSPRRTEQKDERNINFHDDQFISHRSSAQKRLLRTDFTRSLPRLDGI
ncbi:unnamed protein product [Hymenolepis diminuta]|uniref:Uncharacterized protein n=1 Tax=Hymenolepis diminuta TaxID=6216 RepID=A0A564Z7V5_HYMDI|nr:unnamed protein product [Hymenolepis diminuta]